MKTFTQFQEDAYKPPKSVDKVAKQMEKDGIKFPDAEKIDDIKKFIGQTSDFPDNKQDADFKNVLKNVINRATRRSTPIVGRDTKYVEPYKGGIKDRLKQFKAERETKKRFKEKNKYDINKNPNLKIRRHPMIAPLLFDFTNPKKFGGFT